MEYCPVVSMEASLTHKSSSSHAQATLLKKTCSLGMGSVCAHGSVPFRIDSWCPTLSFLFFSVRDDFKAERDSLAERYAMLQRSLAQSEEDEEKLDAVGAQLRSQVRKYSGASTL